MALVTYLERSEFFDKVLEQFEECDIALDIGTGIVPHDYIPATIYVCCEPYHEYVEALTKITAEKTDKIYVITQKTWDEAVGCFENIHIDSVYLIDVIEHLPKSEGVRLLALTEKIVRKQLVVFTPLGFVEQHTLEGGKDAWGMGGAEWQEHKSGWLPEDFNDEWNIYVCKDFHQYNNIGERLDAPFGAFWAIKNFARSDKKEEGGDFYTKLFKSCDRKLKYLNSCTSSIAICNEKYEQIRDQLQKESYLLAGLHEEHNKLQKKHVMFHGEYETLSNKHLQLQQDFEVIQNNYEQIQNKKEQLQGNYEQLQGNYEQLQGNYEQLQGNYQQLQGDYEQLQGNYEQLQGDYEQLQGDYEQLRASQEQLQCDHKELIFVHKNIMQSRAIKLATALNKYPTIKKMTNIIFVFFSKFSLDSKE